MWYNNPSFNRLFFSGYNVSETIRKGIFEVECYVREEAQLSLGYFSALIGEYFTSTEVKALCETSSVDVMCFVIELLKNLLSLSDPNFITTLYYHLDRICIVESLCNTASTTCEWNSFYSGISTRIHSSGQTICGNQMGIDRQGYRIMVCLSFGCRKHIDCRLHSLVQVSSVCQTFQKENSSLEHTSCILWSDSLRQPVLHSLQGTQFSQSIPQSSNRWVFLLLWSLPHHLSSCLVNRTLTLGSQTTQDYWTTWAG